MFAILVGCMFIAVGVICSLLYGGLYLLLQAGASLPAAAFGTVIIIGVILCGAGALWNMFDD